jgi:anti-anti-sigma factor
VVFVDLEGPLTVEADTRGLRELVGSVAQLGSYGLVLNFRGVPQLDCSGIGQLVELDNRVRASGGALTLVNVESRQKRLLQILGLLALLRVCESRQEAVTWCRNAVGAVSRPEPPTTSMDAAYSPLGRGLEPAL